MGVVERRRREKLERRGCILAAAEKVLLEKGLAVATMDEIAQLAEVGKGTLYLYFKSKDELFLSIATRSLRQLADRIERTSSVGGTGLERLRRLVHAHAEFASEDRDRFRVATSWLWSGYSVSSESPLFEQYRALIGTVYGHAVSAIEQGRADGSVRSDLEAPVLAMQLWGAMLGVLALRESRDEVARRIPGIEVDSLVTTFIELLLGAVAEPSLPGRAP
jgi:AcrR family transcriptional regulator